VGSSCICSTYDPSCIVLRTLKFLDGAVRSTVQESVAVVDSRESNDKPTSVLVPASGDVVCKGWLERGSCMTLLSQWCASRMSLAGTR